MTCGAFSYSLRMEEKRAALPPRIADHLGLVALGLLDHARGLPLASGTTWLAYAWLR